jgi:anthranilate/para-aminobenzoate synthase component II
VKLKSNSELITTAVNEHGMNMGFRHKNWQLFGLQFHPESILTENGWSILNNWIKTCS